MKILITGGAGYKGILLTEKLLNLGHKVTILDNFMYGYESILHLIKVNNQCTECLIQTLNKSWFVNETFQLNFGHFLIQGLIYIFFSYQSWLGRLFWIVMIILMLMLGLYWCIQAYIDWRDKPVLTTITTTAYSVRKVIIHFQHR